LAVIYDYMTITEIILAYLKDLYYCGMTFIPKYADGRMLMPFAFIEHDYVHSSRFKAMRAVRNVTIKTLWCLYRLIINIEDEFLQSAAKKVFFLHIHEGDCNVLKISASPSTTWPTYFEYGPNGFRVNRFNNTNDLGELIPVFYRTNPSTVAQYIIFAVNVYSRLITIFNSLSIPEDVHSIVPVLDSADMSRVSNKTEIADVIRRAGFSGFLLPSEVRSHEAHVFGFAGIKKRYRKSKSFKKKRNHTNKTRAQKFAF